MTFVADTHVHLYPCYAIDAALRHLGANLARRASEAGLAPAAPKLAFLTERHDCDAFEALRTGRMAPSRDVCRVAATSERGALVLAPRDGADLYLLAGRQVVTRERVEVLALTVTERLPDGVAVEETIARIRAAGGLPVVSWAPGKWLGARGAIVRRLLAAGEPGRLLIGDTTLRPLGLPEPLAMRRGRRAGYGVIAGSDPLPFAGEEVRLGTYGSAIEGAFDAARPVSSVRAILGAPGLRSRSVGRRGGPMTVFARLRANAGVRHPAPRT